MWKQNVLSDFVLFSFSKKKSPRFLKVVQSSWNFVQIVLLLCILIVTQSRNLGPFRQYQNNGKARNWKIGNYVGFFFENKNSTKSLRTSIYLHIKFCPDPTIFENVRKLAGNAFYAWRHSRHFENIRTSNLKREPLQAKLNLLVKTPCLYHFIRPFEKRDVLWNSVCVCPSVCQH